MPVMISLLDKSLPQTTPSPPTPLHSSRLAPYHKEGKQKVCEHKEGKQKVCEQASSKFVLLLSKFAYQYDTPIVTFRLTLVWCSNNYGILRFFWWESLP